MRDDDCWRESRCLFFFRTRLCRYSELFDSSAIWLANTASKGAIFVRGGVIKFRLVVDNDTTMHAAHTHTVAFSPQS